MSKPYSTTLRQKFLAVLSCLLLLSACKPETNDSSSETNLVGKQVPTPTTGNVSKTLSTGESCDATATQSLDKNAETEAEEAPFDSGCPVVNEFIRQQQ